MTQAKENFEKFPKGRRLVEKVYSQFSTFCRIIHIIITLIFNFTILRDIEKMAGWARIAFIYLASGIGGNLWSSVLIPYQVEVCILKSWLSAGTRLDLWR